MKSSQTYPSRLILFLLTTFFLIFTYGIALGATWYVDAAGSGNCKSWSDACGTIQEAVNAAVDGDEIRVKMGTYALTSSINVDKALAIYGGFAGSENKLDKRDWQNNVTTVDGQNSGFHCFFITANATIDGLTITRGGYDWRAGLLMEDGLED